MESKRFYENYEVRRKFVHFLFGTTVAFLLTMDIFYIHAAKIVFGFLVISLLFSMMCKYHKPKAILAMLWLFDKPKDFKRFPGKGAIFYLAGILVSVLLFERDIASASIIILAVGDTAAHFFGRHFGKTRLVVNSKKLLEGTLAGTLLATIACLFFVPFHLAFFGSAFGMIAEAVEIEYFDLDDNFFIPLAAGTIMTLIKLAL